MFHTIDQTDLLRPSPGVLPCGSKIFGVYAGFWCNFDETRFDLDFISYKTHADPV